ncbi:MAG: ATP-binding cassette domain-containing protein, partial [Verrucomicrobiota bacterium]
ACWRFPVVARVHPDSLATTTTAGSTSPTVPTGGPQFQSYLKSYPGAILMISHDRAFLNALITRVWSIEFARVASYTGNYDAYVTQSEARYDQQLAAYENQQREIERLQRFVDRFRAKASKASQAQSKLKQLEKIERIEAPIRNNQKLNFSFPQPSRGPQRVITLEKVHQAYDDLTVYKNLNFSVERGERVVLVGPNGAGKSTLLKILAGQLEVQSGTRTVGNKVTVGYYSQHRTEMLDPSKSVLETITASPHARSEEQARTLLGCFLFSGADVFKSVQVLSGGEKSRLALIQFLLNPPNLLLMDEPTTHLDMVSIDALIQALEPYEGTLIFISHDVHFIRKAARSVVHISAGELTRYAGDYQYYLDKTNASNARAALTAGQPALREGGEKAAPRKENGASPVRRKTKEQKRQEAEERQARARERKASETRMSQIEETIMRLEARQTELTAQLEDPELYARDPGLSIDLNRELADLSEKLETVNEEWASLAEALASES